MYKRVALEVAENKFQPEIDKLWTNFRNILLMFSILSWGCADSKHSEIDKLSF